MFLNHLPHPLPENWLIGELDQDNEYLELLGHNEEFLLSIMKHEYDNPAKPYFLNLSQLKGILCRYDFESLDWPEWFKSPKDGVESAIRLMEWINLNYGTFDPVSNSVLVSLGTEDRVDSIRAHFGGRVMVQEFQNRKLVFREVNLTWGAASHSEAALKAIILFYETQGFDTTDLTVGFLTNEKFQLIDDLRPAILEQLKKVPY
ncbi:hypothetical protein PBT90_02350 [Algoriphagus halophytocola]|uniref:Uncharacterized protein n=1 Tax=Algoriphagus halophytocola TaxID=2991499 RepID=A0ABY6MJ27_9BACT|nr:MULTISPECIES: hypothetical protein [unclassified Algoriphagus]UZD22286.1 hypothetical protein OM944_16695 [Algoriphagus sp. TR-M5]WBL43533.1 hypothetical protein PBT90_02350 [Algoriphagus sp. TR-M9]